MDHTLVRMRTRRPARSLSWDRRANGSHRRWWDERSRPFWKRSMGSRDVSTSAWKKTQSTWLYEILEPRVSEIVVAVPEESKGSKDDLRDAWA